MSRVAARLSSTVACAGRRRGAARRRGDAGDALESYMHGGTERSDLHVQLVPPGRPHGLAADQLEVPHLSRRLRRRRPVAHVLDLPRRRART